MTARCGRVCLVWDGRCEMMCHPVQHSTYWAKWSSFPTPQPADIVLYSGVSACTYCTSTIDECGVAIVPEKSRCPSDWKTGDRVWKRFVHAIFDNSILGLPVFISNDLMKTGSPELEFLYWNYSLEAKIWHRTIARIFDTRHFVHSLR